MSAWEVEILVNGIVQGFGPVTSAQTWDHESKLDSSGAVSFDMPRADPRSDLVAERQTVRCSTMRGGQWVVIGQGRVEDLTEDMQPDQPPLLEVGCSDDLIALADRTVGNLTLSSGTGGKDPMAAASLLGAIAAFAPAGWTFSGTPSEDTYLAFSGESVLAALGKLASQLGDHFRLDANLTLTWLPKTTPPVASGIRAMGNIPAPNAIGSDTCLITHLQRKRDASKQASRVYAYGGGNAGARTTLTGHTYTLPAGYSYGTDSIGVYIQHDAADAANRIDAIQTFQDVAAIDTATGHATSAANALAQTAVVWLGRHVDVYYSYELEVTAVSQAILPGQTIRVVHDQYLAGRRIPVVDADLLVLGAKSRLDAEGTARIVSLTVANSDRWPEDDDHLVAGNAVRTQSQSSHLQVAQRSLSADTATTLSDATVPHLNVANVYAVDDAANNAVTTVATFNHTTSGAAGNGIGSRLSLGAEVDDGTVQQQGTVSADWIDAASTTRKGRVRFNVSDATTARECLRLETSGTAAKLSFYGVAAVARPATLIQTYNTSSRTLPAYTSNSQASAYTGAADGEAKLTDLNSLRVAYENLRANHDALMQFVNALVDDLQLLGLES